MNDRTQWTDMDYANHYANTLDLPSVAQQHEQERCIAAITERMATEWMEKELGDLIQHPKRAQK